MELKGKWVVTSVESCGERLSAGDEKPVVWEFRRRDVEITLTGEDGRAGRSVVYPVTTDSTKQPKELDASAPLNQKLGFTGIYKLDGNTLTICWNPGVFRPHAFKSSKGNGFTVTTLTRQTGHDDEEDRVLVNLRRG
jgi:uncharacterized protein (TIGR03067 family)